MGQAERSTELIAKIATIDTQIRLMASLPIDAIPNCGSRREFQLAFTSW